MVSILNIILGVFFYSSGVSFSAVIAVKREGSAKRRKLNPFILRVFFVDEGVAFTSGVDQSIGRFR
jgi:hypothetical protein